MNRIEKQIADRAVIDRIIGQARVCRLGLCKDNVPYVVPVSFGYDGVSVYFHTAVSGMKIDYLLSNARVCFEFEHAVSIVPDERSACGWSASFYSVVGWGTASEVTEQAHKTRALNQIMGQYSDQDWSFDDTAMARVRVWRIFVDEVTGKQSHKPDGAV